MAAASRRSIGQLLKQGWNEIPEVLATTGLGLVGLGLGFIGCYNYAKNDGDNRKYKMSYTVVRPDDPRVQLINKGRGPN